MPDEGQSTPQTVIVERSGGGLGAILIGLALLVAVGIGAYFLMNKSQNDNLKTDAITRAADKVGDGATKVGDSAQKAADKATN
jgi:uncharacterized protein (UPF0333 family)